MKNLINKVRDHGKKITIHLKRHHRKYLFGALCSGILALIAVHTVSTINNIFANEEPVAVTITYDSGANITYIDTEWNEFTGIWTITISNWIDNITMLDRNLWATTNDINATWSYWYYFQWWDNIPYTGLDWNSGNIQDDNSRWWWDDIDDSDGKPLNSYPINNPEYRKWPCPVWYHVPSKWEWHALVSIRGYDKTSEISGFYIDFKLPFAGMRNWENGSLNQGNQVYLRSSSPYTGSAGSGLAWEFYLTNMIINATSHVSPRNTGLPVRCFKDLEDSIIDLSFTWNDVYVSDYNVPHGRALLWDNISNPIFYGNFHSNTKIDAENISWWFEFSVDWLKPNVSIDEYFWVHASFFRWCSAWFSLSWTTNESWHADVMLNLPSYIWHGCSIQTWNNDFKIIISKRKLLPINSSFNAKKLYINQISYFDENDEEKFISINWNISGTNIHFVLDTGELINYTWVRITLNQSDDYEPEMIKRPGTLYFPLFSWNIVSNANLHTKNISWWFNISIEWFEPNISINSLISVYSQFWWCTAWLSLSWRTNNSWNADIFFNFNNIRDIASCGVNSWYTVFSVIFNWYHSNLENTKISAKNLYINDYIFTDDNGDDHTINVNWSISWSTVIFTNPPLCDVTYSISQPTSKDVIAYLTWCNKEITWTDLQYVFTWNWSYTFEFQDLFGNTWSKNAEVTWMSAISYDSDANITYTDTEWNVFTWIWIITITNWTSSISMLDRNLWATTNDITKTWSYGYHFQWWNNYWFESCYISGCYWFPNDERTWSTRVSWITRYWPDTSWYVWSTFILTRESPYDWASISNDNLWWWSWDSSGNNRWYPVIDPINRQGPCPDGFHVPSYWEFLKVKDMMDIGDFHSKLLIPFAGTRSMLNAQVNGLWNFVHGFLWSSSPYNSDYHEARSLSVYTGQLGLAANARSYGFSIRCFKNTGSSITGHHSANGTYYSISIDDTLKIGEDTNFVLKIMKDWATFKNYTGTVYFELTDRNWNIVDRDLYEFSEGRHYKFDESDRWRKTFSVKIKKEWAYVLKLYDSDNEYIEWSEIITVKSNGSSSSFEYDTYKFNPKYSDEMNKAYQYARYYNITTIDSIKDAGMGTWLNRIAMAKMLANYAVNVLGKDDFDTSRNCTFKDVSTSLNRNYDYWVTKACQLWIMWVNMPDNKFYPNWWVTRAEFATALSRLLYWTKDWTDKYYSTHINKLYREWIISNTDPKLWEKRWYIMLMLMRAMEK